MNSKEKSNLYVKRGFDSKSGSLRYMGMFSEQIVEGFEASKSITKKMLILDRKEIFDRGALFLCYQLIRTIELKNTPK